MIPSPYTPPRVGIVPPPGPFEPHRRWFWIYLFTMAALIGFSVMLPLMFYGGLGRP